MHKYGLIVSLVVGCGGQDGGGDGAALTEPQATQPAAQPYALVTTLAERPVCDKEREGVLIYVKDTKTFQTCASGDWQDIDLMGPAGADGEDGAAGADGRDGTDGQDGAVGPQGPAGPQGAPGTAGADGQDGAPAVSTAWLDPATGRTWYVSGTVSYSQEPTCDGALLKPSNGDVGAAVSHGLWAAYHDFIAVSPAHKCAATKFGGGTAVVPATSCLTGTIGVYCFTDP